MNNNAILNIAKKMENVWNGYNTDIEIKVKGNTIIEITTEEQRTLTPSEFIEEWADTILEDYHTHDLKYVSEEEIKVITDIAKGSTMSEEEVGMIRLEKMEEQLDFEIHELRKEKQFVEKLIKDLNNHDSKDNFLVNYDTFLQDSRKSIELRISELEQELKELQEDIKDQVAFMRALSIVELLNNDIGADLEQGELFDIAIKAVVDIEKALELGNKLK